MRLLRAYILKAGEGLFAEGNRLEGLLGIFQKLISSKVQLDDNIRYNLKYFILFYLLSSSTFEIRPL